MRQYKHDLWITVQYSTVQCSAVQYSTLCAVCGSNSVEHALSCPSGGYTIHRHNDIRDTTAALMAEVCREVTVEPRLQPTTGEEFTYRSANTGEDA